MRKAKSFLYCILLFIFLPSIFAFAYPDQKLHYEDYEAVLFNNRKYSSRNISEASLCKIKILECATTICIDQFGHKNDQTLLDNLNSWGVRGIPRSVSEINPPLDEVQLSAKNHRQYTHRGWDFVYQIDKAHWPTRKNILLSAINMIFRNNPGSSKKNESFAAILYYIHVLGDYIEDVSDDANPNNFKKYNGDSNGLKIPFAAAQPTSTHDIFYELEYHFGILFSNQTGSRKYKALISDIQDLAGRARAVVAQPGGINTYERCLEIKPLVFELRDILTGENNHFNYIHELLRNEPFFTMAFPDY